MKFAIWLFGIASVVLAACAVATPPPAPPRKANVGLRISSLELANGMRVVLVADPKATEVQVTTRYRVGAADDPPQQAGIAHLVEHLMFQQILGSQSLFAKLEDITTFFNASTSFDATTYVARAAPSHLDELLSIEAVRVGFRCTSITESAFTREREVVINEVRQRDAATELYLALRAGVYPAGHPYRRAIGGTEQSVAAITRAQACAFADAHYTPRNGVLVVSGAITERELEVALTKFLAKIAKREAAGSASIPRVAATGSSVTAKAPLDDNALMFAWPLPADPVDQTKFRTIAAAAATYLDAELEASVFPLELGDDGARMLALVVMPNEDEQLDEVWDNAKRALGAVPGVLRERGVFGDIAFNRIRQGAIHRKFATLEDGSDRDEQLAAHVLAGRDAATVLGAELRALNAMSREEAARIATEQLSPATATIVKLAPSGETKRGAKVALTAPVHDVGQRREVPDVALARQPLVQAGARTTGMTTRTLPNGLRVVLMPLTSVPAIDIRLVFASGTAAEPATKRGAALLAAKAMSWDPRYLSDLLALSEAGGSPRVDVDRDYTSFAVQGVDMHLDYLLAGLRRWVRDGIYDDTATNMLERLRSAGASFDHDDAVTDSWRKGLYGPDHPYRYGGDVRHLGDTLTVDDAEAFRDAHYLPANATLVIAGNFDAALADRWIDFLFADWRGKTDAPPAAHAAAPASAAASIAYVQALDQMNLRFALPATVGGRAQQLVVAEMLSGLAGDVRHQLGASYGFTAVLAEARLASLYFLTGWVDAARATEAVELIRARVDGLRTDAEARARAFVLARKRVVTQLAAITGSAEALADRVQHDASMGRAPLSDARTAEEVKALTVDAIAPALAELDLTRAVMLLRGPQAEVERAYAALGRTPTQLRADAAAAADAREPLPGSEKKPLPRRRSESLSMSDFASPLTEQAPPSRLSFAVMPGYSTGEVLDGTVSGYSVGLQLGYRFDRTSTIGLSLSIGKLSGTYDVGPLFPILQPIEVMPITVGGFLHGTAFDRLWGGLALGVARDRVIANEAPAFSETSLSIVLEGGLDAVKLASFRIGVFGRIQGELVSDASVSAFSLGLAFRR